MRFGWLCATALAGLVGACGTTTDDRPQTLEYITETILKPSCAAAECHSSFKQQSGYQFDTVEGARFSISQDSQLIDVAHVNDPMMPPALVLDLTLEQAAGGANQPARPRMPYDAPLPNADIDLIQRWIEAGFPGICDPGATKQCVGTSSYACTPNGAYDFTRTQTICPTHPGDPTARLCSHGDCQ